MRLLKFPHDLNVRRSVPTSAAIISLVVVLPAEPVMAMSVNGYRSRIERARFCSAAVVSSTLTMPFPSGSGSGTCETTAPRAVASACGRN